jgi:cephalosporin hydroxylase
MGERYTAEDVTISDVNEEVVVEEAQDVMVEPDAVQGNLIIKNAEDVIVKEAQELQVEDSQDVIVENGAAEGGSVNVNSAASVSQGNDDGDSNNGNDDHGDDETPR